MTDVDSNNRFREYKGPINHIVQEIIADGRHPITAAELMQKRLDVLAASSDASVKSFLEEHTLKDPGYIKETSHNPLDVALLQYWWGGEFLTGDIAVYHTIGRLKIVPGAKLFSELTSRTPLMKGAFLVEDEVYQELGGTEFNSDDIASISYKPSSKRRVTDQHPIYKFLLALVGDKNLLNDYVETAFRLEDQRYKVGCLEGERQRTSSTKMMVILDSFPKTGIIAWPFCIYTIRDLSLSASSQYVTNEGMIIGVNP